MKTVGGNASEQKFDQRVSEDGKFDRLAISMNYHINTEICELHEYDQEVPIKSISSFSENGEMRMLVGYQQSKRIGQSAITKS